MKKLSIILALVMTLGFSLGVANAQQVVKLNVPGSLLVFPLVDNLTGTTRTIINVANRSEDDVWLKGLIVAHDAGNVFHKKDFVIEVTQKQPFIWDTSRSLSLNGGFVQAFDGLKGFIVLWAIDNEKDQLEIPFDYLKGDAVVVSLADSQSRAFRYNAIPHQSVEGGAFTGDGILMLDGATEYAMASQTILCEGFAGGYASLNGTLAVANLGVDLVTSTQPKFDINFTVWNENEIPFSRHLHFDQYEQYTLSDLQLLRGEINSNKFQFSTIANGNALWAVFWQYVGGISFGGQCFMDPDGAVPTTLIVPLPTQ